MGLGLDNKVVIITGAARGLGQRYSLGFSREGAKVAVVDVLDCAETVGEIESRGGEVLSLRCDVTSKKDTVEMAKRTVERFGRIDVIVNNAGIYGGLQRNSFDQIPEEEILAVVKSHVLSTVSCCAAVVPFMKTQGGGKIVNITSGLIWNASPRSIHYAASKGAIPSKKAA